ncbi:hypothetical protein, partial [Sporisorium scitamineum]
QALMARYKDKADLGDDQRRLNSLSSPYAFREHDEPLTEQEQLLRNDAYQAFQNLPNYFEDPPRVIPPPLQKPVMIPQRRQSDRLRGFQLLYAPALAESGVSEQQFISFLNRLNVAIGFDNKIKIFNFAIDVGTIACSSWELLVATIGTQALTTTAAHLKSRVKSEAYVAHSNERFFHPRGLHAQIVPVSSVYPQRHVGSPTSEIDASTQRSSFQFSLGSPNVLPEDHPKAHGGLFNLNKRPIEYDPFDYGPGYVKIRPDQYSPMRPSQYKEPATSLIDKAAEKVEKYNVWQDRLPAKKNARKNAKQQETIEAIRRNEGEAGVMRYIQQQEEEHEQELNKEKSKLGRFLDRNKVILVITNLDDRARAQMQCTLANQ